MMKRKTKKKTMTTEETARHGRGRASRMAGALGAVLLLCAAVGWAADRPKQDYSVIVGTVWTADDRPAPSVAVKIRRADRKRADWELLTNARGEFVLHLPIGPADYLVWAEIGGRKSAATETEIHIEYNERQDIGLHLKE